MIKTAVGVDDGDESWMSTADAARYLGVTPRTLYRLIDDGDLAAYRFGRVIRLRRQDVYRLRADLHDE